jgi:hypothetical protein
MAMLAHHAGLSEEFKFPVPDKPIGYVRVHVLWYFHHSLLIAGARMTDFRTRSLKTSARVSSAQICW